MKASMWIAALLLVGFLQPALAKMEVVTTLPDLAAIARAVGGDEVEVTALVEPRQDPHYVDARPSLLLPLSRAKLLVVNGLELESGWLPPLLVAARNSAIQPGGPGYFDASTVVEPLDVPSARIDRTMGDIHGGGNPHFTFDPRAARRIAVALARRMGELDAEHAATFTANAETFARQLDTFAASQAVRFRALPQRQVVPYHRSLRYLLDWLGLDALTHVEPRPGIQPDPAHVARVLELMKANGVRVLVQEEFYPQNTSETLSRISGAKLVVLPGGTRFREGQSYLDHLREVVDPLFAAMSASGR